MPNPALDPKNKIVAIYNRERTKNSLPTIDGDDYTFSLPEVYTGPRSIKNSRVKLTPKVESLNIGDLRIYYDRINFSTLSGFSVEKGTATTVLGLLAKINEELGVELTATDIEEAALGVATTFNLTASPQNLLFIGTVVVGLT